MFVDELSAVLSQLSAVDTAFSGLFVFFSSVPEPEIELHGINYFMWQPHTDRRTSDNKYTKSDFFFLAIC